MSVDGQTMINPNALALKTVLAVDDTPENLAVVNALLRGLYKVKVSSSGEHALAIAANTSPDLILLDIMMPGLDGYEVCRRLKVDPATADIPVIFLTAKSDEEGEQRGFDLGAVDYITKPISPPLLLARVKAQLSLKEARDALQRNHMEDKQRFELAMAQQMEINTLKSTFVSMTTHEFRTPLTTIMSSQELLRHYGDACRHRTRRDL
jgi:DNA-binding response OmpR family regulator